MLRRLSGLCCHAHGQRHPLSSFNDLFQGQNYKTMKKKYYTQPTIKVVKINFHRFLLVGSGVNASRSGYGTAKTDDDTEQTWE